MVNINPKYEFYFWIVNSKSDLSTLLIISFSETLKDDCYGNKSEIGWLFDFTEYI